jgi:NAD(P)-dependent dehydrogenase (short-subunit alcohol dehydrogenase family)
MTSVAVVTGASRGIGRAAALALAQEGFHVVAIARSQKALESLDDEISAAGGSASLVPMDLKDFDAIDRLGGVVYERWGKLDALLVNAATLGELTTVFDAPPKMVEETFATNVLATHRLVRSFHRLLLTADPQGRVLFVTSAAAHAARPFWSAYAASKAALEALALAYAAEVAHTGIRANVLDPGRTRTAMRAKAFPGEDPSTLKPPEALAPLILELLGPDCDMSGEVARYPA